jgi:hypothetical protein
MRVTGSLFLASFLALAMTVPVQAQMLKHMRRGWRALFFSFRQPDPKMPPPIKREIDVDQKRPLRPTAYSTSVPYRLTAQVMATTG